MRMFTRTLVRARPLEMEGPTALTLVRVMGRVDQDTLLTQSSRETSVIRASNRVLERGPTAQPRESRRESRRTKYRGEDGRTINVLP